MPQSRTLDHNAVLADALVPSAGAVENALLVVLGSLVIAASAQLKFVLPGTPVPVTGQTFGVLYAAALLGSKRGAAAAALYLVEGFSGLPFFATGVALGPTLGYLLGFLPAAYLTGLLAERGWDRSPWKAFAMNLLGSLPIFAFGLLVLARFVEPSRLLAAGLWPFVAGDIVKSAAAAGLLPLGWKLIGKR
jgi:biotin transport system substrate-specific component